MRARPHTLLTNRYMTPFDPPKNPVARVSHFHFVSHISHKYINSLCTSSHLHSHFHTTLFALNDLNGSCFTVRGLFRPSLLKPSDCLRRLSQSYANKKSASFKTVLLGTKSHCFLFHHLLHSSLHSDPCEPSPSHRVPHNIQFMIQHTVLCSC